MITARSCIVNASPGQYQLSTILRGMVKRSVKRGHSSEKRKENWRRNYLKRKAALIQLIENTKNLPDDDCELWPW